MQRNIKSVSLLEQENKISYISQGKKMVCCKVWKYVHSENEFCLWENKPQSLESDVQNHWKILKDIWKA